ncbi:unnamed protein product [Prorocentrum cordatum]|uniref:PDZ domain-containing protein n=1 Tax=Prorocentrum cordatum TaxID=2364126 RepID=A0ABN9UR87_9DINO|nr:unnamed protein product [Polarella glacialis]
MAQDQERIHVAHNAVASGVTATSPHTNISELPSATKKSELDSTAEAALTQDAVQDAEDSDLAAQSYVVTLHPGPQGLRYNEHTGQVIWVKKGGIAEQVGIQRGDTVVKVNGSPYSEGALHEARAKAKPYELVVWRQSLTERIAGWTQCLSDTAICTYVVLRLMHARFFVTGTQGGNLVLACMASSPVLILVLLSSCARVIFLCTALMSLNVLPVCYLSLCISFKFSLVVGAYRLCNGPLAQMIPSEVARTRTDSLERVFFRISLVYWFIRVVSAIRLYTLSGRQLGRVFLACSFGEQGEPQQLSQWFYLYGLVWGYARVTEACSGRLHQVSEALPCDGEVFDEKVRKPIIEIVSDLCPALSYAGMPILLMCAGLVRNSLEVMPLLVKMMSGVAFFGNGVGTARVVFDAIIIAVVLTEAPFGISSAQEELTSKLAEARTRDPSLHVQIAAVETMLAQTNRGQGFGIPAGRTCVLTKVFFQTLFFRVAATTTILMTVAKHLLGYEQDERRAMNDLLVKTDLIFAALNRSHNTSSL